MLVLLLASWTIGFIAGRKSASPTVAPAVPPPLPKEAVAVAGPTVLPTLALAQPADATPTCGVPEQTVAVAQPTVAEPPTIAAPTAAADPTVEVAEHTVAAAEPPTVTAPPSHAIALSAVFVAPLSGKKFHIRMDCKGLRNNSGLERVAVSALNSEQYNEYTPCKVCCSDLISTTPATLG